MNAKANANAPLGSAAAEATRRKEAGNAAFKAGRYRVASAEYDAALTIMRAGGAATTTTKIRGEGDEGDEGDEGGGEEMEVVLGGRDAAVCYANRAAARLMRAAEEKDAEDKDAKEKNAGRATPSSTPSPSSTTARRVRAALACARETRLALADCRAALVADAGFDRARLRAGTCLMRLGFFAAAERTLSRSSSAEARGLANDASRARETLAELRGGALDRLRAATTNGAARGARAAKRRAALLAEGAGWAKARAVANEAAKKNDSTETMTETIAKTIAEACSIASSIASRARRVADLAPHCAAAAEASALSSMFAGDFADAVAAADREGIGGEGDEDGSETWRAACRAVCRVAVGALDEAIVEAAALEKEDGARSGPDASSSSSSELVRELSAFARDQTTRRAEGNALFKSGKYAEASAAYTAAIAAAASHPLAAAATATTLCNRAATAHAEGRLVDALADCGRALALNPAHAKSLSRRAQVHAELRLWDAAVEDLERLAATAALATSRPSAAADAGSGADRVDASRETRLRDAKIAARASHAPDHYRVLGLRAGAGADETEVRRAYRKLALGHHPDKCRANAPSGADPEALRADADRLFKLVGEAHAVLSDPSRRAAHDAKERANANAGGGGGGGGGGVRRGEWSYSYSYSSNDDANRSSSARRHGEHRRGGSPGGQQRQRHPRQNQHQNQHQNQQRGWRGQGRGHAQGQTRGQSRGGGGGFYDDWFDGFDGWTNATGGGGGRRGGGGGY